MQTTDRIFHAVALTLAVAGSVLLWMQILFLQLHAREWRNGPTAAVTKAHDVLPLNGNERTWGLGGYDRDDEVRCSAARR